MECDVCGSPTNTNVPPELLNSLKAHSLFYDTADIFIENLASHMTTHVYEKDSTIVRKGEEGRCMFFVMKGSVRICTDDDEVTYGRLSAGAIFGEVALLYSVPRTATVRANERTVILVLQKNVLNALLQAHPLVAHRIQREAEERYVLFKKREKQTAANESRTTTALVEEEYMKPFETGLASKPLERIAMFKGLDPVILHRLALTMNPVSFRANDVISEGESSSLYFIVSGVVYVWNDDGTRLIAELLDGSFFGEGYLMETSRKFMVTAATYVDTLVLNREDLQNILEQHPAVRDKIMEAATARNEMLVARQINSVGADALLDTHLELLSRLPLFSQAEASELNLLAARIKVEHLPPNYTLIQSGSRSQIMYIVILGMLDILDDDEIVNVVGPGEVLGEIGVLFGVPRTATVRTATGCSVLSITGDDVRLSISRMSDVWDTLQSVATARRACDARRQTLRRERSLRRVESILSKIEKTKMSELRRSPSLSRSPLSQIADETAVPNPTDALRADTGRSNTPIRRFSLADSPRRGSQPSTEIIAKLTMMNLGSMVKDLEDSEKSLTWSTSEMTESEKDKPFTSTSPEIMLRILKLLDVVSLVKVSRACKLYNTIAESHLLWKTLDLCKIHRSVDDKLLSGIIAEHGDIITSLNLGECWLLSNTLLEQCVTICPKITKISLRCCWPVDGPVVAALVKAVGHQLKALDLTGCKKVDEAALLQMSSTCIRLEWLSLSHIQHGVTDAVLFNICANLHCLRHLSLARCTQLTSFGNIKNGTLSSLLTIDLSDCVHVDDKAVHEIMIGCPDLQALHLSFCTAITQRTIVFLADRDTNLISADFSYCSVAVTADLLKRFVKGNTQLTQLTTRGLSCIDLPLIISLFESQKSLKYGDFSQCTRLKSINLAQSLPPGLVLKETRPSGEICIVICRK